MCGIVGYVGGRACGEVLLDGLARLEYRGYDSAGVAILGSDALAITRRAGKLAALREALNAEPHTGHTGIGHTRWATHGAPTEQNAHPHRDTTGTIAIVHNGIIENHRILAQELASQGIVFQSETDSEVLAHLIRAHYEGDLERAFARALERVEGSYAVAAICSDHTDLIVAARHGSPLIVGAGEGESFLASDIPALLPYTRSMAYLEDGDRVSLRPEGIAVMRGAGHAEPPRFEQITLDETSAEKAGYPHFMLKEIHEQPRVLEAVIGARTSGGRIHFDEIDDSALDREFASVHSGYFVACGTACHAGLVGKYCLEHFAGLPMSADLASEFRYRSPVLGEGALVVPISQSGETADTLEAVRIAQAHKARVLALVNVVGSSMARLSDATLYTQAGPELGVASTKAYTAQVLALLLLALRLGQGAGRAPQAALLDELRALPDQLDTWLTGAERIANVLDRPVWRNARSALFLGRHVNFPSALEGALKLKEISYIHAEGCSAGEMKHGPIALVTPELPVVAIATRGAVYEKMISNIQEVKARGAYVLALATEGDTTIGELADDTIAVPECSEWVSPLTVAPALQLLAYYAAVQRGCDVDQPRNLAKSVTVE